MQQPKNIDISAPLKGQALPNPFYNFLEMKPEVIGKCLARLKAMKVKEIDILLKKWEEDFQFL